MTWSLNSAFDGSVFIDGDSGTEYSLSETVDVLNSLDEVLMASYAVHQDVEICKSNGLATIEPYKMAQLTAAFAELRMALDKGKVEVMNSNEPKLSTVVISEDKLTLYKNLADAVARYRDEVTEMERDCIDSFENLTQARERLFAVLNKLRPKSEQQAANDLLRAAQAMAVAYERDVGECRSTITGFERAYRDYETAVQS